MLLFVTVFIKTFRTLPQMVHAVRNIIIPGLSDASKERNVMAGDCIKHFKASHTNPTAVATKTRSVARSLKLSKVDPG